MACCVTKNPPGGQDFAAPVGRTVRLTVDGPPGITVKILHIRYGSDPVDEEDPFEFKVIEGAQNLIVLVEAEAAGAELRLVEACDDGSRSILRTFFFDPGNPAKGFRILGQRA
jgi:hypothetical protein